MAEVILKDLLSGREAEFTVLSAGTHATAGQPAADGAVQSVAQFGLDLSGHHSDMLSPEFVAKTDLLLTMTQSHKDYITQMYPEAAAKTFTLKGFADGTDGDVNDPFGSAHEVYEKTAQQLRALLRSVVPKLKPGERDDTFVPGETDSAGNG